jgi:alpha-glucosidase/alpha-D-xyloside xylohydrolase
MRPIWLADPRDQQALRRDDEYLWGDSFLVAPVLQPGASQRSVYLPAGQWWDYWTNQQTEGGKEVSRPVDLKTIPLYVKSGAVVPFGPVRQYTTEPVDAPLDLLVYPGADGRFTLYEDDGESFRYQKGEFTRIVCEWKDRERTLTLRVDPAGRPATGRKMRVRLPGQAGGTDVTIRSRTMEVKLQG